MKEVWDQILKVIPAEALPALVLIAAVFFGVYYAKGLRSYTDAINDRWFLTAAVLIAAVFLIIFIQKREQPEIVTGSSVALLVPRFENDEARNVEGLFTQEVRAAVHSLEPRAAVIQFDGYIRDPKTAALTATTYKAATVIYEPKVVRVKDNIFICFSIFAAKAEATKPYSPSSAQIDKQVLADIANTVIGFYTPPGPPQADALAARIESLEKRVAELAGAIFTANAGIRSPSERVVYSHRLAIIVGVDRDEQGKLPRLQYTASDATAMSKILNKYGFDTTLLLNPTKDAVIHAIQSSIIKIEKNDLFLFYYGGASFRSTDVHGSAVEPSALVLPTYDLDLDQPLSNLTLTALVEQLGTATNANKLIILDGCHGTYGLNPSTISTSSQQLYSFQIMAASEDDQYAFELATTKGGVFTQPPYPVRAGRAPLI